MRIFQKYKRKFPEETYIKLIFREILGRNPDRSALKFYSNKLNSGQDLCSIIDEIYTSPESITKNTKNKSSLEQEEIIHEDGAIQIPHFSKAIKTPNKEKNYKILLFKVDNIGDLITSLGAFSLIRNAFPSSHLTLMCQPANQDLAKSTSIFDDVLPFSPIKNNENEESQDPSDEDKNLLSQLCFDIVVDYHQHGDMRKYINLIKSSYKIGYESKYSIGDYNVIFPMFLAGENDYNISMSSTLNLSHSVINYFTINDVVNSLISRQDSSILDEYLGDYEKITIVLQPFASTSIKSWSLENYINICGWLSSTYNCQILVLGVESDIEDDSLFSELLRIKSVISLVGKTSLNEAVLLISSANLFIGNDTGLTHISAHLNIPTIAIMSGCENIRLFAPRKPSVDLVYYNTACSPCHLNRLVLCREGHICLKNISVDTMKKIIDTRVNEILSRDKI